MFSWWDYQTRCWGEAAQIQPSQQLPASAERNRTRFRSSINLLRTLFPHISVWMSSLQVGCVWYSQRFAIFAIAVTLSNALAGNCPSLNQSDCWNQMVLFIVTTRFIWSFGFCGQADTENALLFHIDGGIYFVSCSCIRPVLLFLW